MGGFESRVQQMVNSTDKPIIITEFGQSCQATDGASESCPGTYEGKAMGYDETILTIAEKYKVSWLPWSWRPMAGGPNSCTITPSDMVNCWQQVTTQRKRRCASRNWHHVHRVFSSWH